MQEKEINASRENKGVRSRLTKIPYTPLSFLNGFKISDIDQLILALIFRFGVILV